MMAHIRFCLLGLLIGAALGEDKKSEEHDPTEQRCPPGEIVQKIKLRDGILDIVCGRVVQYDCQGKEERRDLEGLVCSGEWVQRCPQRHALVGIRLRDRVQGVGNYRKKFDYHESLCCTHSLFMESSIRSDRISLTEKRKTIDYFPTNNILKLGYVAGIIASSSEGSYWIRTGLIKKPFKPEECTTTPKSTQPTTPTTPLPKKDKERKDKKDGPNKKEKKTGPQGAAQPPCFSADTLLHTPNGDRRMDQIKVGDRIMNGVGSFEDVEFFLHRETETETEFLEVETEGGGHLLLTPRHLLPLFPCRLLPPNRKPSTQFIIRHTKFAERLVPGVCVLGNGERIEVISVNKTVQKGIFSPVTASGYLMAGGVQASCYSTIENQLLQQAFFSTVRKVSLIVNSLGNAVSELFGVCSGHSFEYSHNEQDIPPLIKVMRNLFSLVSGH